MKYLIFSFISLFLTSYILTGCQSHAGDDQESRLRQERDSLLELAGNNQRDLERMTMFFDEVASCIDSITEQETLLALRVDSETGRRYSSREVAQRLRQLSDIITLQRQRIASLVDSLNNRVDTVRTSGLRSTITYLTTQLAIKEQQIQRLQAELSGQRHDIRSLTEQVEDLTTTVGDLTVRNSALTEAVQVQTEIINEGYVLVADKKKLQSMGIIEGGGFLRRSKTNLGKVDLSQCGKVNIAVFTGMTIPAKKVKLLSPAPAASYTLLQEGDHAILKITDTNAFWSLSNILVIQTQ